MLPDRSILIAQKLLENAKIAKKSNATFLVIFKHCDTFYPQIHFNLVFEIINYVICVKNDILKMQFL